MSVPYTPPAYKVQAFNCAYCRAYARQLWRAFTRNSYLYDGLDTSTCTHCNQDSIWWRERMLIPNQTGAPPPHADMPASVRDDYEEAADIAARSPRGAAALLRLSLQELCDELGERDKTLNDAIASLVEKGLSDDVQMALDSIRVVGNNAVHPGELNVDDDPDTAAALFELINYIVEDRVARPKRVAGLYGKLPAGARAAIDKRDGRIATEPSEPPQEA